MLNYLSSAIVSVVMLSFTLIRAQDVGYVKFNVPAGDVLVQPFDEDYAMIDNGSLYINTEAVDIFTQETFGNLIKERFKQNLPYVIAVVNQGNCAYFFDGEMFKACQRHNQQKKGMLKNQDSLCGEEIFKNPLTRCPIEPHQVRFYSIYKNMSYLQYIKMRIKVFVKKIVDYFSDNEMNFKN